VRPASRRAGAGFTLIEMIVVLAVLGFVLGMVLSRGPQRSARLELDGAAREIAGALRGARARAIAQDRPVLVAIDAADHAYTVDGATHALPKQLPLKLVANGAVAAPGAAPGGGAARLAAISFLPDGSSSGGRVEIAGGARRVLIGVDWLTGRVSVADGT
jgi:general secretion pathway protein H